MIPNTLHPASVLGRLVVLRWFSILAQVLTIFFAAEWLSISLPLLPMLAAVLFLTLVNILTWWQVEEARPVTDGELFAQLCLDVLALAWLLYFAGGAENPFISLLLLPLTIGAVVLPVRYIWAMAVVAFAAYTLLIFFNQPLSLFQGRLMDLDAALSKTCGMGRTTSHQEGGFALHVVGMWLNFAISALIVSVFLARNAGALRQREHEIHVFRERALRQEQILALGLLAAGAAHKLGTPLSTMAVVLREMELSVGKQEELAGDLRLLRSQVERCKGILAEIAGAASTAPAAALPADTWLAHLVDEWHILRPKVRLPSIHLDTSATAPSVRPDRSLDQALQSLLDNAADASPEGVELRLAWDTQGLTVDILDRGQGIDEHVVGLLGQTPVSSKSPTDETTGGLGIGFFLTNATIERFGGEVEVFDREGGGTCTRVILPLAQLNLEST